MKISPKIKLTRGINKTKLTSCRNDLKEINWEKELTMTSTNKNDVTSPNINMTSVNNKFNRFHEIISDTINKHLPMGQKMVKNTKSIRPWVTAGIKNCENKSRKLFMFSSKIAKNPDSLSKY